MAQKEKSSKTTPAGKNRRSKTSSYHHGDLRNALLASSVVLLKKHGPQKFSLRELAQKLGVSSAAPYRHFESKEKIFAALAAEGFGLLNDGFTNAIERHPDNSRERLNAVGVAYYQFALKFPEHLQMMFGNIIPQSEISKDAKLGAAAGEAFGTLVQVISSCQADGTLDSKENSKMLAILIWSSIHGFATLDLTSTLQNASGLSYDPELLVQRISNAMLSGLNQRP